MFLIVSKLKLFTKKWDSIKVSSNSREPEEMITLNW